MTIRLNSMLPSSESIPASKMKPGFANLERLNDKVQRAGFVQRLRVSGSLPSCHKSVGRRLALDRCNELKIDKVQRAGFVQRLRVSGSLPSCHKSVGRRLALDRCNELKIGFCCESKGDVFGLRYFHGFLGY